MIKFGKKSTKFIKSLQNVQKCKKKVKKLCKNVKKRKKTIFLFPVWPPTRSTFAGCSAPRCPCPSGTSPGGGPKINSKLTEKDLISSIKNLLQFSTFSCPFTKKKDKEKLQIFYMFYCPLIFFSFFGWFFADCRFL